jgi:sugar O-acyltransferase (sialic acid O-acetyltransferase NeuD family)
MTAGALAIVGAGGHARVLADCAEQAGWSTVHLYDGSDHPAPAGPWVVHGSPESLLDNLAAYEGVIVGLGANAERLTWLDRIEARGGRIVSLFHPHASVSSHAVVGPGSAVLAGACVCIGSCTGRGAIINTNASVDHDTVLGEGVHVSPGAAVAGGVRVGARTWIGVGAAVRQGIVIGEDVTVGAGAVVIRNVADGVTVVGVPGRPLER